MSRMLGMKGHVSRRAPLAVNTEQSTRNGRGLLLTSTVSLIAAVGTVQISIAPLTHHNAGLSVLAFITVRARQGAVSS